MGDHDDLRTKHEHGRTPVDRATPGRDDQATGRSSDRVLDPGDSHDKGERSLCVGEAA